MTSVMQIWAKTLDQFPLLVNFVFILYDHSFTSIPSYSSPSVWMVCCVTEMASLERRWTDDRQNGCRDKRLRDQRKAWLSMRRTVVGSIHPHQMAGAVIKTFARGTDGQTTGSCYFFCCCLCSHEPGWPLGRVFCDLIPPRSSVCVCGCVCVAK